MEPGNRKCRACGADYPEEMAACPRCNVSSKGDVDKRAIGAFLIVLLLMLIGGGLALLWAMRHTG